MSTPPGKTWPLGRQALDASITSSVDSVQTWCAMQVRAALYECMLAGTLPVIFDPKLPQVLPFSDVVDWEALLTVLNAEDVVKKKEVPVDILKVWPLFPSA